MRPQSSSRVIHATLIVLLALAAAPLAAEDKPAQDKPTWVQESNLNTHYVLEQQARLGPEFAARSGLEGVDEQIIDLGPDIVKRTELMLEQIIAELRRRLAGTEDPRVRQDLEILIGSMDLQLRQNQLTNELMLPYLNVSQLLYFSLNGLLDPALPAERQQAALVRLRRYAGLEEGYTPLTELARALVDERLEDKNLLGPYRGQL